MDNPNSTSYGKKLWLAYIAALFIIGSVATLGAFKIQQEFNDQENGSKVINLAGLQRMLSQRLSKNALLIQNTLSLKKRQNALIELEKTYQLFLENHKRLTGFYRSSPNSHLDLSFFNTPEIDIQYGQLNSSYKTLIEASQQLLNNQQFPNDIRDAEETKIAIERLLNSENEFLERMNKIVNDYARNATNRLNHVNQTSQLIFFSIIIALVLTALFIFRPASKKITLLLRELYDKQLLLKENNQRLNEALDHINNIQISLMETEKQIISSGIVSGFTHDVNTPIGICITSSSLLQENSQLITDAYAKETMTRRMLEHYLEETDSGLKIIRENLQRANDLIKSFNKIAANQRNEEKCLMNLSDELLLVINALQPKLRKTAHNVTLNCPDDIVFNSYPSAFYRIFTNLIINSLIHGFENIEAGNISISIHRTEDELIVIYSDDGHGISDAIRKQIFDAYFSTKKNKGGTGLGTYIIYNQVTEVLNGEISCNKVNKGIQFKISIPFNC